MKREKRQRNEAEFDFDKAKVDRQAREMTFSKWAGQWFGKSVSDTNHLTHLEEFFGPVSLSSIDDESVKRYREKRAGETVIRTGKPSKKAVSQTTINKEVDTLRKFLRLARWSLRGRATAS